MLGATTSNVWNYITIRYRIAPRILETPFTLGESENFGFKRPGIETMNWSNALVRRCPCSPEECAESEDRSSVSLGSIYLAFASRHNEWLSRHDEKLRRVWALDSLALITSYCEDMMIQSSNP